MGSAAMVAAPGYRGIRVIGAFRPPRDPDFAFAPARRGPVQGHPRGHVNEPCPRLANTCVTLFYRATAVERDSGTCCADKFLRYPPMPDGSFTSIRVFLGIRVTANRLLFVMARCGERGIDAPRLPLAAGRE